MMASRITRRTFVVGTVLVGARAAWGQTKVPRIALMGSVRKEDMVENSGDPQWASLFAELRSYGFVENQTAMFDRYTTFGQVGASATIAQAAAASKPSIAFAASSTIIAQIAASADPALPVVFVVGDALATGLVTNLAHPGANLTGANTTGGYEIEGKRIELLLEAVPRARSVGYILPSGDDPVYVALRAAAASATDRLGLQLVPMYIDSPYDDATFQRCFDVALTAKVSMFVASNSTPITNAAATIAAYGLRTKLPGIAQAGGFAAAGGFMQYGGVPGDAYRRAARYIARILNGEKAGDLPVTQPDKYLFTINLRTADVLGIAVPRTLLLAADEVIE